MKEIDQFGGINLLNGLIGEVLLYIRLYARTHAHTCTYTYTHADLHIDRHTLTCTTISFYYEILSIAKLAQVGSIIWRI